MLLHIQDVLTSHECKAISDAVSEPSLWRDGKETAKGLARSAKENQQADPSAPSVKGVVAKIESALSANAVFTAAAHPAAFVRLTLNRYEIGMSYGEHVDAAYIHGQRTDLSFTLFLSPPDAYEGGALVIENAGHEDAIRGTAGSVVLYPSNSLHRVETVNSGARLACIGWIRSRVRSAEHRALLYDMEAALAELRASGAPPPLYNRLLNIRNNLLRTFGE
jgi:PKHD-type hydroxylase